MLILVAWKNFDIQLASFYKFQFNCSFNTLFKTGLLLLFKAREHTAGRKPLNKLSTGKKCKHCVLQLQFCNPRDNILEGFLTRIAL